MTLKSSNVTQGVDRAPNRSLFAALGYTKAETDRPLVGIDPQVRGILRLGLYQLRYLDRIPPHAAINESVARLLGFLALMKRA